tara:strand:- start:66270 stop:67676 length:1407 start_codon:yes stop_codon:yes gene_type:complete
MKTSIKISTLLIFAVSALIHSSSVSAQDSFTLPEYEKFTLENGVTVYLMEQHEVPVISVSVAFSEAAAINDGSSPGLANMTASALLFGTENYTKSEIEEQVDYLGASIFTLAGKEYAALVSRFASKDTDVMLNIIQELITSPKFDEEELENAKQRAILGLAQSKESPGSVISDYFNGFLYGDHPYSNPVNGTKSGLESIGREEVVAFYESMYRTDKTAIVVVGDFETKEMKSTIENAFKGWQTSSSAKTPTLNTPKFGFNSPRVLLVNKDNATETTFYIGGKGVPRSNPDYVALTVLNTVLGGRFTSWLNDALRINSGLTYGARSRFVNQRYSGTFQISTFTANETTEPAIDLALAVYDSLHTTGINKETLESAKNYVKGGFPPDYETTGSLAQLLISMYIYEFDESFINTFQKNVDQLDVAKAKMLIEKYFPKENLQFVLIGKAEAIKDIAAKYGTVSNKEILDEGF